MVETREPDYEHLPGDEALDETDVSLRAYFARMPAAKLAEYDPGWSDEQVMAWDGNFRSDGALMLVCCERDVDVAEYRRVLEAHLRVRQQILACGLATERETTMDAAVFDELQQALTTAGPQAAIDLLCATLRERKDYAALFYALLLKKRHELGISPVPTGPSEEMPAEVQEAYENAIREAGRLVGNLYLQEGNIPHAWAYFRMLGEPQPVAEALEKYRPGEEEDVQALVEIGYHHGVNPKRGFDLLLERYGICSAITTVSSGEFPHAPEVRTYCINRLVRALYQELYDRLAADIARREGQPPAEKTVRELMAGRDWLFEDDFYHIDVSHLSAVVQMSTQLPPGEELDLAREMCAYGKRLSSRYQYAGDPPFENQYHDYAVYLDILAGENVEEGLAHFRAKAERADPENEGTAPAEVLVNLLLRLNRPDEALAVARKHLANTDNRSLLCPNINELCQRAKDYCALAEVAREQGDAVHFLAGLLEAGKR